MTLKAKFTVEDAQQEVKRFLVAKGPEWSQLDHHFYLVTHLMEEVGELARHVIAVEFGLSLDRTGEVPLSREEGVGLITDDLGDLLYHLLKLAVAFEVDLAAAFRKSLRNIKQRYG